MIFLYVTAHCSRATSETSFQEIGKIVYRGAYDDDNGVAEAVNDTEWIESSTDQSVNYEDDDNSTIISIVSSEDTHKGLFSLRQWCPDSQASGIHFNLRSFKPIYAL